MVAERRFPSHCPNAKCGRLLATTGVPHCRTDPTVRKVDGACPCLRCEACKHIIAPNGRHMAEVAVP